MSDAPDTLLAFDGRYSAAVHARGCADALSAGKESVAFRWCIQLSDDLKAVGAARLAELVSEAAPLTGDIRYDALIAAIVENACTHTGVPAPAWVEEGSRTISTPTQWYSRELTYLHDEASLSALPIFRAHGVLILPGEFESV